MNRHAFFTCITSSLLLAACSGDSGGRSTTGNGTDTASTTITASGTGTESGGTDSTTGSTDSGTSAGTSNSTSAGTSATTGSTDSAGTSATSGTSSGTSASGSDTSTSGGSGGSSGGAIEPCDVADAVLQPVPPNIMLVLDKSGSMVAQNPTRWSELHAVVTNVLNKFENAINFGALLFPNASATNNLDQTACTVSGNPEVGVGPTNGAAILGAIPPSGATNATIKGGTPGASGIASAVTHLKAQPAANPRAIIYITDGAANCQMGTSWPQLFNTYDTNLHTNVANAWTNDEIPTYVVGIDIQNVTSDATQDGSPDNTNPWERLDQLANEGGTCIGDCAQGGTADFYQTNNQAELDMAMDTIAQSAISCSVPLNPEPPFPELMVVKIGGMEVPQVMDCATEDGWMYTNPNCDGINIPCDSIELCGTWCDSLKMEGELKAEYFCMPG